MDLCARICEPMRLSAFFRSLLSLHLQQLRSSFMSNDFRVWKEVYSIKKSVWTKSMWNKILAQPEVMGIMHVFIRLTYSISVLSLHSPPSHHGDQTFLVNLYLLSIPTNPSSFYHQALSHEPVWLEHLCVFQGKWLHLSCSFPVLLFNWGARSSPPKQHFESCLGVQYRVW